MDTVKPIPDPARDGQRSSYAMQVEALYRTHYPALVSYLRCRLQSEPDAQEVAQETYVRLLTLVQPTQVNDLRAYLFRIATNLAVDRLRSQTVRTRWVHESASESPPMTTLTPERQAMAVEQLQNLRRTLREMPPKTSHAFVAYMIEGRDFGVIARAMHLSERMVRYHVTRALVLCRTRVDDLE
ncbi:RNA polymerase sigma factor [Dyella koreensis]|uniref:RNA polymerase sigma factor n=1 Tax=Dyella koreensis TaxID=311235 RepID=A0ABW8K7X3_9GAMM